MSWLFVEGMVYHCTECGDSFKVDYDGGPCDIQVGESGVFMQRAYNEKYGLQMSPKYLDDKYWQKPQYLHEECLCAKCYATKYASLQQDEINATVSSIEDLMWQISAMRAQYAELYQQEGKKELDNWVNNADFQMLQSIAPGVYDQSIGHRLYSFPANRKKLNRNYISSAEIGIIEAARTVLNDSAYLSGIVAEYRKMIEPLAQGVAEIINKFFESPEEVVVFEAVSIKLPRNLNQYLCYEKTLGIPEASTPDKDVYYLLSYSPSWTLELLKKYAADNLIYYSPFGGWGADNRIDEKQLIKKLSVRLEQLSNQYN